MLALETAINWFEQREGVVSHSMAKRNGNDSYDSSSAVYYALISADILPVDIHIGNTDSLFGDLEANGWEVTTTPQRGCIFIWGRRGASSGAAGHTGIFIDDTYIIHCNKTADTISTTTYQSSFRAAGSPEATLYINPSLTTDAEERLSNIGELDLLMIKDNKIIAEGWHYSYDKEIQYIEFVNAETDAVLARLSPERIERPDLNEIYPDEELIAQAGFHAEISVQNGTAVYVRGIRTSDSGEEDVLTFSQIIIYEQAFDIDVDNEAATNEQFYMEIYDQNGTQLKKRIYTCIGGFDWPSELMYTPTVGITLPIEYLEYFEGRDEVKMYINQKVFHGIVMEMEVDKETESIYLTIHHVIAEWNYRQISTNLAAKSRTINDIYSTLDFRYVGWNMTYLEDSATRIIDYVYSRQTKYDGLTTTCELTNNIWWRVGFDFGRKVELGTFGERKNYVISHHSGNQHIRMLEEPLIEHDYENVINIATVYGEKSDSGMSSMSLREVFEEPGSQHPNFPVYILRNGINNERNYDYIEFSKLAPNNDIEYTVLDLEGIALEGGIIVEGTYSFNDLAPFNIDGNEITDEDRALQARIAYEAVCKRLVESRRRYAITIQTERLPVDIKVGDQIRLEYDNALLIQAECNNYMKKILNISDWFYITRIDYNFDDNLTETNTVVLEKHLHTTRISTNE